MSKEHNKLGPINREQKWGQRAGKLSYLESYRPGSCLQEQLSLRQLSLHHFPCQTLGMEFKQIACLWQFEHLCVF